VVRGFETENRYDKLIVNGEPFSGNSGPSGIVPQGSISWSSDSTVEKTGFHLCPQSATATTTTTTTIPYSQSMWEVKVGQCQIDRSGCVSSPNYPEKYGSNDKCVISVTPWKATPIKVESFHTESYDKLQVNGKFYHSDGAGLEGVLPVGDMVWESDGSLEKSGWKLCPTP